MEQGEANQQALLAGLEYLLNISFVRDDEILKICLDFWHYFVPDVYDSCHPVSPGGAKLSAPLLSPSQVLFLVHTHPHTRIHTHTHTHTHPHPYLRARRVSPSCPPPRCFLNARTHACMPHTFLLCKPAAVLSRLCACCL